MDKLAVLGLDPGCRKGVPFAAWKDEAKDDETAQAAHLAKKEWLTYIIKCNTCQTAVWR
jgi:hypothetical protein